MEGACPNHPEIYEELVSCARCGRSFCRNCTVTLGGETVCGTCKADAVRDVQSGALPQLALASVGRRFSAMFVDGLIVLLVSGPLYLAISSLFVAPLDAGEAGPLTWATLVVSYALLVVIPIAYEAIF